MTAVAVKANTVRRERATTRPESSAVRNAARRRKSRLRMLLRYAVPSLVVGLFLYVGLYAWVTSMVYSNSRLTHELKAEQVRHRQLEVDLARSSSDAIVTGAARKSGMVYGTRVDYLRPSETVASVSGQGE